MNKAVKKQTFPTATVLSVVGRKTLTNDVGNLYGILNFLVDDNLYTHQLQRAADQVRPWILYQHPELEGYEDSHVNPTNWRKHLAAMEKKYGATMVLEQLPEHAREPQDPLEELAKMVPPDRILVVRPDDDGGNK